MFLTGYIAGVHFVRTLAAMFSGEETPAAGPGAQPLTIESVGRTSEGEFEVVAHESLDEAFDHIVFRLYPYAVVVQRTGGAFKWFVARPDVPDDKVAQIEVRAAEVTRALIATSMPSIACDEDFDAEVYFDGFAAGLDAEERWFAISRGTLGNAAFVQPAPLQELRR